MTNLDEPFFVIGIGRSGTSLIQSMLASHSQIAFPPETSFFRRFVATGVLEKSFKRRGKNSVVRLLQCDQRMSRTGLDINQLVDDALDDNKSQIGASIYTRMLSTYAARSNKTIAGDKDPRLIENLKSLHDHFPAAKILHIFRDPRDVLASKKRAAWSRNRHPVLHILVANLQWRFGDKYGSGLFGDNYRLLQYERLLAGPKQELTEVCEWLGVEFEDAMLSHEAAAKDLVTDEEYQWKKETLGPLLENNAGKWVGELSSMESELVERANDDIMNAGGYIASSRNSGQSLFRKTYLNVICSLIDGAAYSYVGLRQ